MTTETFELFFALLTIATLAATAGLVGARLVAGMRGTGREVLRSVAASRMVICAAITGTATLGSLYFSEVAHFVPCTLCWYQRIAMYPLVPLLGIAAFRRDTGVALYGAVIAALGAPISIYHILVERGIVEESSSCDPNNPCSLIWVKKFGYLTIPTMALSGFLLIITLLVLCRLSRSEAHGH